MSEQVRGEHGHGPLDEMPHTHFHVPGDGHDHRPGRPNDEGDVPMPTRDDADAQRDEVSPEPPLSATG